MYIKIFHRCENNNGCNLQSSLRVSCLNFRGKGFERWWDIGQPWIIREKRHSVLQRSWSTNWLDYRKFCTHLVMLIITNNINTLISSVEFRWWNLLSVHNVNICVSFFQVFLSEYAGPLAIYLVFYTRPAIIYGIAAASEPRAQVVK